MELLVYLKGPHPIPFPKFDVPHPRNCTIELIQMKTIAKRILDQSSTQRDLEDKNSNDDPVVSDNEHSKNPE